ncbi:MAG: tetratricopeptide repeat protein [Myxococcota bacterium]
MSALLLLLLAASPAAPLNTEGFKLYQAGKYGEAIEKFRAAIAADETHALAHYNLAATLALMRTRGKVCEFDAYQSAVLEHLERAVQLDERRRRRMQVDRDLDSIRDTLRYQQLLGRRADRPQDAKALLVALSWYTPAVGAYGNPETLRFGADGRFTLSRLVMGEQDDAPKRVTLKGRWKLEGVEVTLAFDKPLDGATQARGKLTPEGRLEFGAPAWTFTDARAECDA